MSHTLTAEGGQVLVATPVLDTYFRFACARQDAFVRRAMGEPPPWTDDPIIPMYRFTNPYRASDRVSQYLIRHVQYTGDQSPEGVFFRTILFKMFNKVDTWEALVAELGEPVWAEDFVARAGAVLDGIMAAGRTVYNPAYMMPQPPYGGARKHDNHLLLLDAMMREDMPNQVANSHSLERVYRILRAWPSIGDFLAFQYAIDLNYSSIIDFSEMDFVVAGPGAVSGIRKCFSSTGGLDPAGVIRAVAHNALDEFERLGLEFQTLWGRPLQLIDFQNLFCETDKYARVAHPEAEGAAGRSKIKQRYTPGASPEPIPQWYPPKWGVFPYGDEGAA